MHTKKFINFLHTLDMENELLEAILEGYKAVFEAANAWSYNNTPSSPFVTPLRFPNIGTEPSGSYQKIMKQLPSSIGAVGGAGENTRSGNNEYKYEPALPQVSRDIGEETREDWEDAPKFKKITTSKDPSVNNLIDRAKKKLPQHNDQMFAPINYYTNFRLGNFNTTDINSSTLGPPF